MTPKFRYLPRRPFATRLQRTQEFIDVKRRYITAVVGEPLNAIIEDGLNAYFSHIEQQMIECILSSEAILRKFLAVETANPYPSVPLLLDFMITIGETLKHLDTQSSVDDAARALLRRHSVSEGTPKYIELLSTTHQMIFNGVGWMSLFFVPNPDLSKPFSVLRSSATLPLQSHNLFHIPSPTVWCHVTRVGTTTNRLPGATTVRPAGTKRSPQRI